MAIKLRDDQLLLVEQVLQNIHDNNLIVSPSGSGKSYIIAYLEHLLTEQGYTVYVYAPTLEVREQLDRVMTLAGSSNQTRSIVRDVNSEDTVPDYIILDETHHSEANTYQDLIEKFSKATLIGLTATPKRLDGKGFDETFDHIVIGKQVRELIEEHILSKFKYYAPSVSQAIHNSVSDKYLHALGETFFQAVKKDSSYTKKIYADVIKTWKKYGQNKQTILFAPSVKMSKRFAKELREAGIKAEHIEGTMLLKERKELIDNFRAGKITILCNVDLISEGFDMNDADCVILTRPTESLAMFMQQSFRALRYREGKEAIILDHADNISLHGSLDQYRDWSLEGSKKQGGNTGYERTVWEIWNNDAVFDTSVELKEVIKDYHFQYDDLIEKSLKLGNLQGFIILNEIQKDANIMSVNGMSWAYAYALEHGFDIPRLNEKAR